MKTVHRYVLKELTVAFVLALVAVNFILMSEEILRLTRVFASVGATLTDMARIILYLQPQITVITTPMAFLLSMLVVYGRMNADNEVVILRTSGMRFRDISRPAFVMGVACFLLAAASGGYLAPAGAERLEKEVSGIISRRAPQAIEEGVFTSAFKGIMIYVRNKPGPDRLGGMFLYDERKKSQPIAMYASSAQISSAGDGDISITLKDGDIYIVSGQRTTDLSFGRYNLLVPITMEKMRKRYTDMDPAELLKAARKEKGEERLRILLEFQKRFSLPALCLILSLLGPPLAMKAGKTGRLGGLSLGLIVFALYYAALVYAENMVRSGSMPHYIGAWAPAALLGVFSLWMFRRAERV